MITPNKIIALCLIISAGSIWAGPKKRKRAESLSSMLLPLFLTDEKQRDDVADKYPLLTNI